MKLIIQPILLGDNKILKNIGYLKSVLETVFEFDNQLTVVNDTVKEIPTDLFDNSRVQYISDHILSWLYQTIQPSQDTKVLAVCDVDAYFGRFNFCFGEAIIGGRVSAVYLKRLLPTGGTLDEKSLNLFHSRVVKEAIHEIGHTFGLKHCSRDDCIMFKSRTISDTDKKKKDFCEACLRSLLVSIRSPLK